MLTHTDKKISEILIAVFTNAGTYIDFQVLSVYLVVIQHLQYCQAYLLIQSTPLA